MNGMDKAQFAADSDRTGIHRNRLQEDSRMERNRRTMEMVGYGPRHKETYHVCVPGVSLFIYTWYDSMVDLIDNFLGYER